MRIKATVTIRVTNANGTVVDVSADSFHDVGDNPRFLTPDAIGPTVTAASDKSVAAAVAALNPTANEATLSGKY